MDARRESSNIFQPFRVVGLVTSNIPFAHQTLGKENFIYVAIGKSFQVIKCDKLNTSIVSQQLPRKIKAIAAAGSFTFTACSHDIIVWDRISQVACLKGHRVDITQLIVVGSYLLSVSEDNCFKIWNIKTYELLSEFTFPKSFSPTVLLHPPTYLNKVLIGSEQGKLYLWNLRKQACVYEFKGWGSSVKCIASSPAIDTVAIGLADGRIIIHNIRYDKTLMTFQQESGEASVLTFRTDSSKSPLLASGSTSGALYLWNLEEKRLESTITSGHDGKVISMIFLPHEPLLISSGDDNSIKMWIFDQSDGSGRLLKSISGHKSPPNRIRYYGGDTLSSMKEGSDGTCCQILSSGQDRTFRVFHTAREQQNCEMSQGPLLKKAKKLNIAVEYLKLSPIRQFASMDTRERDWSNIITCHDQDTSVYVWQFSRRAIGKHILRQFDPSKPIPEGSPRSWSVVNHRAMSVAISSCGNYGVVGTLGGSIFKYNIQSGLSRGAYPKADAKDLTIVKGLNLYGFKQDLKKEDTAHHRHTNAVYGVAVDALNKILVSGSLDGTLKFWDFIQCDLLETVNVGSPISQIELHRDSNLLAIACDDCILRIYDLQTKKLVRRFSGHEHRITDIGFTPDARWLISSSSDNTLRVWDLPTARCVDWLRFDHAVTGIAISSNSEFVATTHVGQNGIYLWANKSFFSSVSFDGCTESPIKMDLPVPVSTDAQGKELSLGSAASPVLPSHNTIIANDLVYDPLGSGIVTLSSLPRSHWQTLFNLELIKQRNKPIEAPKAPASAPFFLPTLHKDGVNPSFSSTADQEKAMQLEPLSSCWDEEEEDNTLQKDEQEQSRILTKNSSLQVSDRSKLVHLLQKETVAEEITAYLKNLSASAVDVEFSKICAGDFDEEGISYLELFIDYLHSEISSRSDFEVVQAYLNRFLRLYGELLGKETKLSKKVKALHQVQQDSWSKLQALLRNNLCLVQYFSNIQI